MNKFVSAFLIISTLSMANGLMLATRAVRTPGFSLANLQKKKPTQKKVVAKKGAKAATAEEWRWFGRDRDSKAPPAFLKLYDGKGELLGKYPELKSYDKAKDAVKRNPYQNNAPIP